MKKEPNLTLKTIATRLGVSTSTVSRVLSGKGAEYRISEQTSKKIYQLVEELNFTPNILARSLRLKKTNTIGLIIPDISNPFFASIAKSVEREARKFGYSIILCDTEETTDLEIRALQILRNRKVDGLIILPVGQNSSHLKKISNRELPIVIVDRYFNGLNIPYVGSDNYQGAKEAVKYLIENGHHRIACIQGLRHTTPGDDRVKGYIDAHKETKCPIDHSLIVGDNFGEQNGYIETKLLLKRKPYPSALFALSNLISMGALRAVKEEGLNVPEDISIISFDDQPYSGFLATPMTTVAQQNSEMGKIAVKLLFDQMTTKESIENHSVILPTTLIIRKSVQRQVNNYRDKYTKVINSTEIVTKE